MSCASRIRPRDIALVVLLVGAWALEACVNPATAADKAATEPNKVQAPDSSAVTQAAQLALQGEARRSPMLLLAAAELLRDHKQGDKDLSAVKASKSNGSESASQDSALPALDVDALIHRARELAKDDPELLKAVDAIALKLTSGERAIIYEQGVNLPKTRLGGVNYVILNAQPGMNRLDPGETYTISNVIFEAGVPARVGVTGDGDGDLDIWVYDENSGGLIGRDTGYNSVAEVIWTPKYQGPFTIKVSNVGSVWEEFYVLANW